jgi:hypothetical protein
LFPDERLSAVADLHGISPLSTYGSVSVGFEPTNRGTRSYSLPVTVGRASVRSFRLH